MKLSGGQRQRIAIARVILKDAHLDRILVFSRGEIIEDGSHAALLARRGAYHRLWIGQSGGLLPEAPGQFAEAQRSEVAE